jgi:hypothetical protein
MYPSLVQKMRNLKTDLLFIAIPRHWGFLEIMTTQD